MAHFLYQADNGSSYIKPTGLHITHIKNHKNLGKRYFSDNINEKHYIERFKYTKTSC